MDQNQILFIGILAIALVLFIWEVVRVDIVGIFIILALSLTGLLEPKQAFSGFSSEPAIILSAVFVLSAGLSRTGVTDFIGRWIGKLAGSSETRINLVIMTGVAFMSAFTHHVMVTAMMLPIVMDICRNKNIPSSRILIPMATSASLGTLLTIIGAPAFLVARGIIVRSGGDKLGVFEVGKVGLPIVIASFAFILIARWLLPKRTGSKSIDERFKLSEITTEIIIPNESRWVGYKIKDFLNETKERFEVFTWLRKDFQLSLILPETQILEGDVFLIKLGSDELISIEEKYGLALRPVKRYGNKFSSEGSGSLMGEQHRIFKGIISPDSKFIGRTLSNLYFYHRYGVVGVGIWRKDQWIKERIADSILQAGDLVVLWGPEDRLEELTKNKNFLMFMPFEGKPKRRVKARLATVIMLAAILCAAFGWIEPFVAFVAGALAMVLTKCLPIDNAYRSIETKIFVMIAGVIPLGMAMEKTGVDQMMANFINTHTAGWSAFGMLMVFFWAAALLTQILSDAATVVLIGPIAVAFAKQVQISPTAAVVVTTIGAVASFLTPIGHHGNLLILSPGGYKFNDFLKIGLPLTLIISIMACYLSLRVW